MFKKTLIVTSLALSSLFSQAYAAESLVTTPLKSEQETSVIKPFDVNVLKMKLKNNLGLEVEEITPTPLPGIVLVITNQGLLYVSNDGEFIIQGKAYRIGKEITNLADESLAKLRLKGIAEFSNDVISYPAKDEKYVVTVFTDITCGYCRKLHEKMPEYNAKGITVKYLPYPRAGIFEQAGKFTQGYKDLRSIWCNEDPNTALTKAKLGSVVAQRICESPVEKAYDFGRKIGVSGTPAIVLANGTMIPGYQEPDKLAEILANL